MLLPIPWEEKKPVNMAGRLVLDGLMPGEWTARNAGLQEKLEAVRLPCSREAGDLQPVNLDRYFYRQEVLIGKAFYSSHMKTAGAKR